MKKYTFILLLLGGMVSLTPSNLNAQEIRYLNIDFDQIRVRPFNDTMLMMLRFESVETPSQSQSFTGTIVLSLCGCYCDSLWDAWPDCYPDCFKGTGSLGFIIPETSVSGGGSSGGTVIRSTKGKGTLGIKQMDGGILREEEFVLPVKYKIEVQ